MARKNGMKRLFMYVIVIIGSLFVGFLAYFFARNEETIALTIEQGAIVYLNEGNSQALPLRHTKPSKSTKITITSSNEEVVRYSGETKTLHASKGGVATITITTTNKDFGPFKFDVFVGNGTVENPWYISTSRQFSNIGKGKQELTGENFLSSHAYELIGDIDLGNIYTENTFWTPISTFEGSLQGEGHSVMNLKVIADGDENVGLFRSLSSTAVVENINFYNAEVIAHNSGNVGILAGINKGFIGKVNITGSVISSGENTIVGGVVGVNQYETSRPVLNMVSAKVSFITKGLTGGLVGRNNSGILFNSSIIIKDLKAYTPEEAGLQPYNTTHDIIPTYAFGGIAGENEGGLFGTDNDLRQSANKNIFVKFEKLSLLSQNAGYNSKVGIVAYTNSNAPEHDYFVENNYINIVTLINTGHSLTELGNGQNISDKTNIERFNDTSFIEISNIEELSLTEIWLIDRVAKVLVIDFEASYENHQIATPGARIIEKQGIIDAFNKVLTTTSPISYHINLEVFEDGVEEIGGEKVLVIYGHEITGTTTSVVWGYDENKNPKTETNWTKWTPINSNNSGYNGEFIVEGGRVVIKNLLIETGKQIGENTYYGLFSNITGKNTIIKNIGVENVIINADSAKTQQLAGGLAGAITEGYVENVIIDGIEINNADVAGFAFGTVFGGTMKNVSVGTFKKLQEEVETETHEDGFTFLNPPNRITTNTLYSNLVNFGGFAGIVHSDVENVEVHYGLIKHQGTKEARIGGFTGTQQTNTLVKDIKINYGLNISNTASGKGYYGGVSGYVSSKAIIEYAFSLANISVIITVEEENHAGGIAGYLATEGIIRHSFAGDLSNANGDVSAKHVGGIVSINHGSVFQSQASGTYKGHNVGGAAYINHNRIENVLITAALEATGTSSSLTVAGIAVWMPKGSVAKYIISTASFKGLGETALYAETRETVNYTGFENFFKGLFNGKIWNGNHKTGSLENFIIVNPGSAIRQKGSFGNWSFWLSVLETSEDELKLQGGENPYAKMGFLDLNNFIWRFESGNYPVLLNIATNPYLAEEEDYEEIFPIEEETVEEDVEDIA